MLQDDRIWNCSQLDANRTNNNTEVTVIIKLFANGRMLSYSTKLDETLVVQTTDLNNGSEVNGNITVIAMYSNTATGTSKNSIAINIPYIIWKDKLFIQYVL